MWIGPGRGVGSAAAVILIIIPSLDSPAWDFWICTSNIAGMDLRSPIGTTWALSRVRENIPLL